MKVNFITPTILSRLDISSMGDSSKRGDSSTIGQFDSGLKYCIALLLRNNVEFIIKTYDNDGILNTFKCQTELKKCKNTNKEKELINILFNDYSDDTSGVIETGFALQLGYNWELWMALRELYSNMLDEKGHISTEENQIIDYGTVMTLNFNDTNPFFDVWQNKHLYINTCEPLYKLSDSIDILKNDEGYLRIYKQNILVFENKTKPSRFAYNIKFGEIDERRILSNISSIEENISSYIMTTTNEDYLRSIITPNFEVKDKEFLSYNHRTWGDVSNLINKITTEVYEEFGEVSSYDWLISKVKDRRDCKIGGKKIKTIEDSLWNYSTTVSVETTPVTISEPDTIVEDIVYTSLLQAEISKIYDFKLNVEVKTAKLLGSKVVADKYEKCIIISEDFSIEKDFAEFLVEYIDLTQDGNVIKNLSNYILKLIKK